MDIFFLVTTTAVILWTVFATFIFWRVMRILKSLGHVADQVSRESDQLRNDLAGVRAEIIRGKSRLRTVLGFLRSITKRI